MRFSRILIFFLIALFSSCKKDYTEFSEEEKNKILSLSTFPSIEDKSNKYLFSEGAILLGNFLFHDSSMSPNKKACASCHLATKAFSNNVRSQVSTGRNTPSIFNSIYSRWFF